MTLLSPGRRSPFSLFSLAALCLAAGPTGRCMAEDAGVYYSKDPKFRIPFQVDAGDRRVTRVLLHVSRDEGRSYEQAATADPREGGFNYHAKRDGWHWFTVQTMDQDRRLYPPSIEQARPGLKVFVDTRRPEIRLEPLSASRPEEISVEWNIRDDALDLGTLTLDYRPPGGPWQSRGIPRVLSGQLSWDPAIKGEVEVRIQVKDRAGNLGEASTRVRGAGGRGAPPGDGGAKPAHTNPGTGDVRKVNSKSIRLNYKIDDVGPSGVSVVEVWMTRDTRDWKRYGQDAGRSPPFVVDVTEEGRYGFTLIARSGVDLGEKPPRPGDEPQVWVEVDVTRPEVANLAVDVGRGPESGTLTITWRASDRNLSRQPVSIFYATKREGPWTPVPGATNLDNTGRHVWRMPDGVPYQFFLRVEALDEAGNIGNADTPEPVKVDLSLPKARVIGVEPAKP